MPVTLFPPELLSGTLVRSQCMHRALCFFPLLTQQRGKPRPRKEEVGFCAKILLPVRGAWVQSLVRELDSTCYN